MLAPPLLLEEALAICDSWKVRHRGILNSFVKTRLPFSVTQHAVRQLKGAADCLSQGARDTPPFQTPGLWYLRSIADRRE